MVHYNFLFVFLLLTYKSVGKKRSDKNNLTLGILVLYIVLSLGTIIPECCVSWTDPKILNNIEKYVGEIKFNY